jgi:hypothetical protein
MKTTLEGGGGGGGGGRRPTDLEMPERMAADRRRLKTGVEALRRDSPSKAPV